MDKNSIWGSYVIYESELIVKNYSGSDMLPLVVFFNSLPLKNLYFVNSNINDYNVEELKGIGKVDRLRLNYCNNITDPGLRKLIQIIKPQKLEILYCSQITDECIQQCKNTIDALTASASNLVSTTQCINKDSRGL